MAVKFCSRLLQWRYTCANVHYFMHEYNYSVYLFVLHAVGYCLLCLYGHTYVCMHYVMHKYLYS